MAEGNAKRGLNLGDVIHIVQILILVGSIGVAYERFDEASRKINELTDQVTRMEHYLSSKDGSYWKLSRENQ